MKALFFDTRCTSGELDRENDEAPRIIHGNAIQTGSMNNSSRIYLGAASLGVAMLLLLSMASPGFQILGKASARSATNLTVGTVTQTGDTLTGLKIYVTTTSGSVVSSGFSPVSFSLAPGDYLIRTSNYGGERFSHWSDGTTNATHPVIITSSTNVSLTAVYCSTLCQLPTKRSAPLTIFVNSSYSSGRSLSGMFVSLQEGNKTIDSGFTPVNFTLKTSGTYVVSAANYANAYFYQWDNGVCTSSQAVIVNSTYGVALNAQYMTSSETPPNCATFTNSAPPTSSPPPPGNPNGITVYASRIPATYWAPCFALVCSAGTGPGATMFFILYNSAGGVVATAFANENGYTFTGLNPGATYYVYPLDCDNCHGSNHNVVFEYWNGNPSDTMRPMAATVGQALDAWFACTNGCGGS